MRSTRADDYQDVPRPVAVMAKDFPAGATTGRHSHPRAQLLYATTRLMGATAEGGTWAVPAGHGRTAGVSGRPHLTGHSVDRRETRRSIIPGKQTRARRIRWRRHHFLASACV